jgi:hypothetical protein
MNKELTFLIVDGMENWLSGMKIGVFKLSPKIEKLTGNHLGKSAGNSIKII